MPQYAFSVALLVVVLPLTVYSWPFLAFSQQGVDQTREFVGRSGHRFGLVHASAQAPEIRTQCRLTAALRSATTTAGRRSGCEARLATRLALPLITLPPVILVPGYKPSQRVEVSHAREA